MLRKVRKPYPLSSELGNASVERANLKSFAFSRLRESIF